MKKIYFLLGMILWSAGVFGPKHCSLQTHSLQVWRYIPWHRFAIGTSTHLANDPRSELYGARIDARIWNFTVKLQMLAV
ncbi:MAG: hypothetical protein IPO42_04425 [Chitinophagaceae bacterium]|nr:hypothetical protein [Chitinophagaceae bacterium]